MGRTGLRSRVELRGAAYALALLLGCDDRAPRPCLPGDYARCVCNDGQPGFSVCSDDGLNYEACGFCGTSPLASGGAGGAADGGGGSGGALAGFMAPCADDAECASGMCHDFKAKGPHCSHACESDADCESPSPGCNLMGVCKAP